MAAKSKMASKTYVYVFLSSKAQFLLDFKILFCIQRVFLVSNFGTRNLFSGSENGGLVQYGTVFGKKSTFLWAGLPTEKKVFFSICRSQFVVHRPKISQDIKKIILENKNQDGGDFQDGVCTLWKYVFERSIWYIKLIFGIMLKNKIVLPYKFCNQFFADLFLFSTKLYICFFVFLIGTEV
jgi:hypothetical protein